jgi:TRAF3-interacting protein 1
MADVTLEALIPKTQELLQPLIAKPKLADKLLAKPPFRFLHDIFTALIQSTGFAKGLYNDFEMDSGNIKEKLQKTTYLDKMIMCVNQTLGKETDVRSSKIVAGLEAENTNIFLQELARAASDSSLGWDRAVQKTLAVYPSPVDGGAMAAPAEAKTSEPVGQATSKESSGPSDEEKAAAAATAAAEAKARDTVRSL